MQKILTLSGCVDNFSLQLGFLPEEIEQGSYKNIEEEVTKIKRGEIKGIIIDGSFEPRLIKEIVKTLENNGVYHDNKEFPIVLLSENTKVVGTKFVFYVEQLKEIFPSIAA